MKQITVACRKRDPLVITTQKYDNGEPWNVVGGTAPSGVHATRYLRRTSPDVAMLSPLAKFLFENCPDCVFGNYPAHDFRDRVRVYNGETEADRLRRDDPQNADGIIKCYDLENKPCRIDDWHFSIIEPEQTDDEYWEQEASKMLAVGAVRVEVRGQKWEA